MATAEDMEEVMAAVQLLVDGEARPPLKVADNGALKVVLRLLEVCSFESSFLISICCLRSRMGRRVGC